MLSSSPWGLVNFPEAFDNESDDGKCAMLLGQPVPTTPSGVAGPFPRGITLAFIKEMYGLRSEKLESSQEDSDSESEEDLTISGEGSQQKLTSFFSAASAIAAPQARKSAQSNDSASGAGGQGKGGGGVGGCGGEGSPLRAGSFGLTPSQRA